MKPKKRPVVFLDRDGTLNVEVGYIRDINDLNLIEGAASSVRKLNDADIAAVLVTNQSGAARGFYAESHILELHDRLAKLLSSEDAHLDAVYYCPHLEEGTVEPYNHVCSCRKPAVGMVEQAFLEHPEFDRQRSFVVGDKSTDIDLATNCGAKGVLVASGYGSSVLKGEYQWPVQADFQAPSIVEAVEWILKEVKRSV